MIFRGSRILAISVSALCLAPLSPVQAIVVTTAVPPDFTGEWTGTDWSFPETAVFSLRGNSAVAVSDYHVLLTQHIGAGPGDTFISGGVTYTVVSATNPPPDGGSGAPPDLRLLRVDKQLPRHESLYNGTYSTNPRPHAILIGWGYSGTVYSYSYTIDSGSPLAKRWGTQAIDSTLRFNLGDPFNPTYSSQTFLMRFKNPVGNPDTQFEAGLAPGDSGAGAFVKVGERWKLAGIGAYNGGSDGWYDRGYAVDVSYYYSWLTNAITVPGDTNFDLKVDFSDYQRLEQNYGRTSGADWEMGDFDNDHAVTYLDYQLLEGHFGQTAVGYGGSALEAPLGQGSVPEPATTGLVLAGAVVLLLTYRRRR